MEGQRAQDPQAPEATPARASRRGARAHAAPRVNLHILFPLEMLKQMDRRGDNRSAYIVEAVRQRLEREQQPSAK